jgi:hypothetical protein
VTDVRVSRGFLVALAAVAGGALLALVFVLGRESGSPAAPPTTRIERVAPRTGEEAPAPRPRSFEPAADRVERPISAPSPMPEAGAAAPALPGQAPAPGDGGSGNAGADPMRASVASYFDTVERIQVGSLNGNAESVGQEMASALASGDTSSLDKMIGDTEAARARLAALAPPAPCTAHHRESLGSLDDALEVLRALKAAMGTSDPAGQLTNVSARAQALRARADVLQKEETALRERYGLKR